jgi:hypothetical protein
MVGDDGKSGGRRSRTADDGKPTEVRRARQVFLTSSEGKSLHSPAPAADHALATISLDPRANPVRDFIYPLEFRFPGVEHSWDYLTFAYDVFWDLDGVRTHVLAPPPPAGIDPVDHVSFVALPSGCRCPFRYRAGNFRRSAHYWLSPPDGTGALEIRFGGQRVVRAIQPNGAVELAGRRVLFTLSKDNPLEWIVDWARFHAFHFGVDAVLFYDNGSTNYALDDVRAALTGVPGIDVVVGITWPFPFGPRATRKLGGYWCKPAFFEHARRRYLRDAEWALNLDIDELLVNESASSLDDLLAITDASWLRFQRFDAPNTGEATSALPRHRDYYWRGLGLSGRPKYLAFPRRTPEFAEWNVHKVEFGDEGDDAPAEMFSVRHFLALTTGWQGRNIHRLEVTDPRSEGAVIDETLHRMMVEAFDEWEHHPITWTPTKGSVAGLARVHAEKLRDRGALTDALAAIDRAIALEPEDPRHSQFREEIVTAATEALGADPLWADAVAGDPTSS